MNNYLIAFDLEAPLDEHKYVLFKLTALNARKLLDTVFVVTAIGQTASEIADDLTRLLHGNDRALVIRITNDYGAVNLLEHI